MLVAFFAAGEASVEAEVDVFLVVVLFLVVDAPWVVVEVEAAIGSSFFWAWQPANAVIVTAVIKAKTDVFIRLVKLNESRECRDACPRARLKSPVFDLPNYDFSLCNQAMKTRILFAGVLGGIVMFIWGFVSHELLPIGEMGVKVLPNEDAVTSALQTNLGDNPGFYVFPAGGLTPGATRAEKEAAMKKAEEQMASGAGGVLVYRPKRAFNFPKRLGIEFATDVIASLLAAFLLAQTRISSFGGKVGFVLVVGLVAGFFGNTQYMNWFGFPKDYTAGVMTSQIAGFLLVGIVAALILGKRTADAT